MPLSWPRGYRLAPSARRSPGFVQNGRPPTPPGPLPLFPATVQRQLPKSALWAPSCGPVSHSRSKGSRHWSFSRWLGAWWTPSAATPRGFSSLEGWSIARWRRLWNARYLWPRCWLSRRWSDLPLWSPARFWGSLRFPLRELCWSCH